MSNSDEASKRACELIRSHYGLDPSKFDDDYIIATYDTEWAWFMQGWHETTNNNG